MLDFEVILAPCPRVPVEFDYYPAIVKVLKNEVKAVTEYRAGKEKAFNYLYGKVDSIPWLNYTLYPDTKYETVMTVGHKIHSKDLKRIIKYVIENELGGE